MDSSSRDDRLVDLARRMLDGEAIDWAKEDVAESEVREGMKRLQHLIPRGTGATETKEAPPPAMHDRTERFIGDFRLVRKLGEGGMGIVYEAEEQHPRRPVALKVIRGGHHVNAHALRLFQREIHTLARLSHPGIAQLYETGVTDDGMHFFAMELIRGVPLSDWLKKRSEGPLTPAEIKIRLGVFRKICDAVAYAHQKGVIHRDLKPGNILIPTAKAGSSAPDAVPEVKILDFGLARMTDADVQMTTYVTEMGKVQGTLPYMSPEQVRGNPDEIDLRTDVYSLGVILYEMVTGKLPHDLSKAQIPEAVRIICEEPPRSLTTTFAGTKRLDSDVITIANKCLEKETARRYQSAAALGEDVQRHLSDQPILARPPSAAYQFRKLVSRHRGPFAAAAGAFVLLLAFSVAMTVQAVRIASERDRANLERSRANQEAETARQVSDFLESLFKVSDEWAAHDMPKWRKEISPLELLDKGVARIEQEIKDPAIQARLLHTIASAYTGLGLGDKAQPLLKRWAELTESLYGQESLEYADVLNQRGGTENQLRAHAIRSRLLKPDDPRLARSLYWVAVAQHGKGLADAEASYRRALQMAGASAPPDEQIRSWILNDMGMLLTFKKDYRSAVPLMRESLQIKERIYPEDHPDRTAALNALGYTLVLAGERNEARGYLQAALDAQERTLGPDDPQVAIILQSIGELERLEGRLDRARALLERSVAIFDKANVAWGSYVDALHSLGLVAESEGQLVKAIDYFGRAHAIYSHDPGWVTYDPSPHYARVLRKAGRIAEAEKIEASVKAAGTK